MEFKYYPRYFSLVVLVVFNVLIEYFVKQSSISITVFVFSFIMMPFIFGIKYIIEDDVIIKYFCTIIVKRIDVSAIKEVRIVTVKEIGKLYVYIGQKSKETKETGYYLFLEGGKKIKIYSGYQNNEGVTVGKYLINNYKIKGTSILKYKLFNDYLD